MPQVSRRSFVRGAGAAFLLPPIERVEADLVLWNGNLLTMDVARPRAQAVAVAAGRFLAVGASEDVMNLATPRTKTVDLAGQTVVPGFIDAHNHPASAGLAHLRSVDCDLRSIAAIQEALRERASRTPPGGWVLGFKYDDTKTEEGRRLELADLDAVSRLHPVYVQHRGGHTAYVNSVALRLAGVDHNTSDPEGGRFDRDPAAGSLSGRIEERAMESFEALIPSAVTREQRREGVRLISSMLVRAGITSVHDAYGTPEDLVAYQDARAAGELSARIYCLIGSAHLERMLAAGVRTGLGDEWVRVGAIKQTCDGSISERTARLSEPYVGRPDDHGILVTGEAELYERARKAHAAGWQNGIHANGDVAIDIALRVYERLQRELPRRDARFRIEHCTLINAALVERIRALGVIPNPFSTYVYYHGEKMREYGQARLERMFAVRSFLDAGVRVTMTSDYPPGPFEPMMALQSMVTRTDHNGRLWGPAQRVSVEEAVRVGTLHGAYASFEEEAKGSITPGKLADLVVLGRNPTEVEPSALIDVPIERTMVGGRWVHEG
jgi:hypothetical protein